MSKTIVDESIISSDGDPIFQFTEDGEELEVTAGVTIQNHGDFTVSGRSDLVGLKATILGTIIGWSWAAVDAFTSSIALTVGASGRVQGGPYGAMAVEASLDSSIVNHGEIVDQRGFGVVLVEITHPSVVNYGTIHGEVGGVEFAFPTIDDATATLVNHGTIECGGGADDQVGGSGNNQGVFSNTFSTDITNYGTISTEDLQGSALRLAGEIAVVTNDGVLDSRHGYGVDASLSPEYFYGCTIANSGTIEGGRGALRLGAEHDRVTNSGLMTGKVALGGGDDVFLGETGRVKGAILGDVGDDLLMAGQWADTLSGGGGNDTLAGGGGTDRIDGGAGTDTVLYVANTTPVRVDLLAGLASFPGQSWPAETLTSIENATTGAGGDTLIGNGSANLFHGLAGNDTMSGGGGPDIFVGGAGSDVFRFVALAEASGDSIRAGDGVVAFEDIGSATGDRVDLSSIDAHLGRSGTQDWAFGTSHAAGRLWAVNVGADTHIRGNADGDAAIEFELTIKDGAVLASAYAASDFIL